MSDKRFFLDTNVICYTIDPNEPDKSPKARALMTSLPTDQCYVSTQVIQEFCNVLVKKSARPLHAADAQKAVSVVFGPLQLYQPTVDFYLRVLATHERYQLSFYDAAIVQAAMDMKCSIIYSEDLQHGVRFGETEVVNPFL